MDTARSGRTGRATFSLPPLMSFSSVAGEGGRVVGVNGRGRGRLQMRSTAPPNWPAKARRSGLMSAPTRINAGAAWAEYGGRAGEELSGALVHFMMYVNERGREVEGGGATKRMIKLS